MDSTLRRDAPAEIAAAARRRSGEQADYLATVRVLLAPPGHAPEPARADARGALASIESHAGIDPDPPTVSRRLYARVAREPPSAG